MTLAACGSSPGTGDTEGASPKAGGNRQGGVAETVAARGNLICGVNNTLPGFGFVDKAGKRSGFDIDFCRAIAAGVLGDKDKVQYRAVGSAERFTALQAGEIDVLIANTTATAMREGNEGATFTTITFYDGQGMMVLADSGITSLDQMNGATICAKSGTTSELNLASVFEAKGFTFEALSFQDMLTLQEAFISGRCDGWTSDKSQLAAMRATFPGGIDKLVILEGSMSKEPFAPATRQGDPKWSTIVNWIVISTILAEEYGITSANVDTFKTTKDPRIQRFLGLSIDGSAPFNPGLGLTPDFAQKVIGQVGNYQEIYNRNLGLDTKIALERGLNALYTDGGLLYGIPYR